MVELHKIKADTNIKIIKYRVLNRGNEEISFGNAQQVCQSMPCLDMKAYYP